MIVSNKTRLFLVIFSASLLLVDVFGNSCNDTVCKIENTLNISAQGDYNFELLDEKDVLHKIKIVLFGANTISSIPNNILDVFLSLTEVRASQQALKEIDVGIFGGEIKTGSLGISKEHQHLNIIDVSHNNLTHIKNSSFSRALNLMRLDLSHNNIECIEVNGFNGLKNLTELILNNNKLSNQLDFNGLSSLNIIDMTANTLTEVDFDKFITNKNLSSILLAQNEINTIMAVQNNWTGNKLDLSQNKLTNISSLKNFDKLQILNVSRNYGLGQNLKTNDFSKVTQLTLLSLSGIGLKNFSCKSFPTLPDLEILDLSDNELREIQDEDICAEKFPSLKTIDLTKNNVACMDLKKLLLLSNFLCDAPKSTTPVPTLNTVQVKNSTTTPTNATPTKSSPKPTAASKSNGLMIIIWILLVTLCILGFVFIGLQVLKKRREHAINQVLNPEEPVSDENTNYIDENQDNKTKDSIKPLTAIVEESKQQTDKAVEKPEGDHTVKSEVENTVDETKKETITTV